MSNGNAVLLVEGQGDVVFFEALLRKLNLLEEVDIRPPQGFGERNNTVTLFPSLINLLLKRLQNNTLHHLGIIADADYDSGGGFQDRWTQLTTPLEGHGYRIPNPPQRDYLGTILRHPDELPPVGLWLMPDHKNNGMLEDLIKKARRCDLQDQNVLFEKAQTCVEDLPIQLFSVHKKTKAIVYTWLAWQRRPGQTLDVTINALDNQGLINLESRAMKGLIDWLEQVFG